MPINKDTTDLIKVTMPKATKAALEMVAKQECVSLSALLLDAAIELYLAGRHRVKSKKSEAFDLGRQ
jgi:hypothetical protein